MDSVRLIKKAYSRFGKLQVICCVKENFINRRFCKKQRTEMKKLHVFKHYPLVAVACTPDNIKWENLGYGKISKMVRKYFNWFVALIMITVSLIGIIWMKN